MHILFGEKLLLFIAVVLFYNRANVYPKHVRIVKALSYLGYPGAYIACLSLFSYLCHLEVSCLCFVHEVSRRLSDTIRAEHVIMWSTIVMSFVLQIIATYRFWFNIWTRGTTHNTCYLVCGSDSSTDMTNLLHTSFMMTSSNGTIFRVTGPLGGEFTGPGEFPAQRPVTRSIYVFFDLRLN